MYRQILIIEKFRLLNFFIFKKIFKYLKFLI